MNMVRGSTWTGNIAHIDTKKVSRQTWLPRDSKQ
jgi:hypothetical protein